MEKRYFDFRDIFQVVGYGFSGRKISVHFIGLVLAYLIYEILVYLSLFTAGGTAAQDFWNEHALLPVLPIGNAALTQITEIAMWIGLISFACIFFLASTVASKITIEQLRGDFFFSVGDALTFLKAHYKSVLGAFISLLLIQIFLALIPLSIAGLGKLPIVGKPFLMLASLFMPLGFFLGVLIAFITVVFGVSLLFVPAVIATTGADAFETIYQQFAIVWNKPWRMVCYEALLLLLKLIFVPIWAFFCLYGFSIVLLPVRLLHAEELKSFMSHANRWLNGAIEKLATLPSINAFGVFNVNSGTQETVAFTTTVTAISLTITVLMGAALVVAHLFSIASAGNTLIYTILRKKIDGYDLLVPLNSESTGSNDVSGAIGKKMFQKMITKVFGSKEDRDVKKFRDIVEAVNQREPEIKKLTDAQLQSKTPAFRQRLDAGESLDELLPDAFATVREGAVRTLKQRHYDVQIMGGVALHQGNIAEMRTGEGKTLTSTLAVYLNALTGKGVHLATVNDYLARRDAEWMGKIYNFLGLSVGLTLSQMPHEQKRLGYKADITYGVHSEFGFDYLWDNKALSYDAKVQRGHVYAILDEVDSILVDEARTPLIISEPSGKPADLYKQINSVVLHLRKDEHFQIDQQGKSRGSVMLTDEGVEEVERRLGVGNLYEHTNIAMVHHVNQALTAHQLYKSDVDYLVENGEVLLVDEFTGRKQVGRRLSEGLHQAIEAKERVRILQENQTGAKITYQNYFRMYDKLAGMTGTAATEANEFAHIYGLEVSVIPTNEPMIRLDNSDQIYKTEAAKYNAVLQDIVEQHEKGRPVLVGTISIENSEKLSKMLKSKHRNIRHQVLNAKEHAHEADIIAQAGCTGCRDDRHQHGRSGGRYFTRW